MFLENSTQKLVDKLVKYQALINGSVRVSSFLMNFRMRSCVSLFHNLKRKLKILDSASEKKVDIVCDQIMLLERFVFS